MQSPAPFKQFGRIILFLILLFVLSLVLPLALGIWLPDIPFSAKRTLAEEKLQDGRVFRVSQFWVGVDFNYHTELEHVSPNGATITIVVDYDARKSWQLPMHVDEREKLVRVTLGGNRLRVVSWDGEQKE
ncbi:MAG TPA: hypothetical protein VF773_06865 [Verrucomicrobiae bacterium]